MKSQNIKSSHELKKEVQHDIKKVERDINELQGRFSPGQLIDDVIFYPYGKNLYSTFEHLKRNPVGTTLLSLGTFMLMEDETHRSYEEKTMGKVRGVRENLKTSLPHKEMKQKIPSKDQIKAKITTGYDSSKEAIKNLDPFAFLALGAGLGIITGASFPLTEKEQEMRGGKFDENFRALSDDLKEAMNASTEIIKNHFMDEVKDYKFQVFKN